MEIKCEGHCHIRQKDIEPITFATGKGLYISGDWVDVNPPSLVADRLNVQVTEGELYFVSATLSSNSIISTQSGDVVF